MPKRFLPAAILIVLTTGGIRDQATAQIMPQTPMELASDFAAEAEKVFAGVNVSGLRIAVAPFANSDGQVSPHTVDSAFMLQGELIFALHHVLPEARLLTVSQMRQDILSQAPEDAAKILAGSLRDGSPEQTGELLKKLRWDAVFLPAFEVGSSEQLAAEKSQSVRMTLLIRFQDNSEKKLALMAYPQVLERFRCPPPSGRFAVELLVDGSPLKLRKNDDAATDQTHVATAEIPAELANRDFSVRLTNLDSPALGYVNPDSDAEKARIWSAAVFVNGINTLAQPLNPSAPVDPSGFGFVSCHPLNAARHLLCPPGFDIRPDGNNGVSLVPVTGSGDSIRVIQGFSAGDKSESFVFRPTSAAVASVAGVVRDAGVISVWFFSQKLAGDQRQWRPDETAVPYHIRRAPKQLWYPSPEIHPRPAEVQRIVYVLKGAKSD